MIEIKEVLKPGLPQCMCENSKPGNVIPVTDGLKCTDCGRDFKYVKPLVSEDLLKAADILEKKAVKNLEFAMQASTFKTIAKALRGEE